MTLAAASALSGTGGGKAAACVSGPGTEVARCLRSQGGRGRSSLPCTMTRYIKAHVTGNVWKIEVSAGDSVEEGTTVAILESMSMEMPVESEEDGRIAAVLVSEGQTVLEGAPMFELE